MRIHLVTCLALCITSIARAQDTIMKEELAPGIFLFRAPSSVDVWTASNTLVVVGTDEVTVFDNSARPSTSRRIIAEIRKLSPQPVRTVINSHWHMDHWMGNAEYARAFPGVRFVASAPTRFFMEHMPIEFFVNMVAGDTSKAGRALAAELRETKLVLPTLTYSDSMTLWAGDRELRLYSMVGDATGSTVLFMPAERILAAGDVLVRDEDNRGGQPWTTNSDKISPWLTSLRRLAAFDARITVPGQGAALREQAYLNRTIEMYDSIITQVHRAMRGGAARLDQVVPQVDLKRIRTDFTGDDPALNARFDRVTGRLIQRVFQEAHDGLPGTP
jgi:glyoxylase-like metal-dependent hydrolase (beta-lactamase superfamily II)